MVVPDRAAERVKTLEDVQNWRAVEMVNAAGDQIGTIEAIQTDAAFGVNTRRILSG